MIKEVREFFAEEFGAKELIAKSAILICAYPVGMFIGYAMERFGGM